MFVIGGTALSTILKGNKSIVYLLGVEVAWVNLFTDVMGSSAIKSIGIHDGTTSTPDQVADEVRDILEG